MSGELDDHIRHVARKISSCEVRDYPFVHGIIDGVFPQQLYAQMLDERPPARQFRRAQFGRKRLLVPEQANPYWRTLHAELLASCVTRAVVSRFRQHVRPGVDTTRLAMRECALVVDRFGYQIPPHSDSPRAKVLSLIFYLPRTDDPRQVGTWLLRPKRELAPADAYRWHSWRHFEIVERIEFRPNRLFVFPVNEHSFHAVPRLWRFTRRESLQAFIAEHQGKRAS